LAFEAKRFSDKLLAELSKNLDYKIYSCPFEAKAYFEAIIVAFSGNYGFGSRGSDDAKFMTAIIKAALAAWKPLGLVIDLSQMQYEWGDLIAKAIDAGAGHYIDRPFPTTIVVSDLNREGLTSLIREEMGGNPKEWLFESLEAAIQTIEKRVLKDKR
jgi:hypothetical protein